MVWREKRVWETAYYPLLTGISDLYLLNSNWQNNLLSTYLCVLWCACGMSPRSTYNIFFLNYGDLTNLTIASMTTDANNQVNISYLYSNSTYSCCGASVEHASLWMTTKLIEVEHQSHRPTWHIMSNTFLMNDKYICSIT